MATTLQPLRTKPSGVTITDAETLAWLDHELEIPCAVWMSDTQCGTRAEFAIRRDASREPPWCVSTRPWTFWCRFHYDRYMADPESRGCRPCKQRRVGLHPIVVQWIERV